METLKSCVEKGMKNSEIAEIMGISERTVKTLRSTNHLRKRDLLTSINGEYRPTLFILTLDFVEIASYMKTKLDLASVGIVYQINMHICATIKYLYSRMSCNGKTMH